MLDLMRKHARSWLIKIALGGIIVVFIFFYGGSGLHEQSQQYVAKVNDTVISRDQFDHAWEIEKDRINRLKQKIPNEVLEKMKRELVTSMIHRVLLLQEGERLGIHVTDEELRQDILTTPTFQRNGMFDPEIYDAYLSSIVKLTRAGYEEERRKEIIRQQIVHLLTDSVKTDPEEVKRFWHFQSDKLMLSCLTIKPEKEKEEAAPDAKDLEAYFKEHQSTYVIPPSVDIQYVAFSWRDAAKQLSVPDEEALTYFQMNPKEFTVPEKLKLRQILFKIPQGAEQDVVDAVKKKAEDALARIKGGEDFAKIASEVSEDDATKEKGGELGYVARGTLTQPLERAIAKLEPGGISEPTRTDQGFYLLKLEEKQPEKALEFPAVKEEIVKKLLEAKAKKKISADADEFYEQVYRTENLEDPAKKFGFALHTAANIQKGGAIPDVGDDPKITKEAFDLRVNEISKLLRVDDNFVILKVTKITKERTPEFDEVRDRLVKDYTDMQQTLKAKKKASEIIEALHKPNQDPAEVAKNFGLIWEDLDPVSRTTAFIPRLGSSPDVSEMLTSVTPAAPVYPTPISAPQGITIVRLISIQPAGEQLFTKESPMFERWIKEVKQTEFLKGWLSLLEKKSVIELGDKL